MLRIVPLVLALLLVGTSVLAEEGRSVGYKAPGHDQHHDWYQMIQKQLGITGCCDALNNDCGPVSTYQFTTRGLEVLLEDGQMHLFTGSKIFYLDRTPDDKAHICRKPKSDGSGFHFYCAFIPRGSV